MQMDLIVSLAIPSLSLLFPIPIRFSPINIYFSPPLPSPILSSFHLIPPLQNDSIFVFEEKMSNDISQSLNLSISPSTIPQDFTPLPPSPSFPRSPKPPTSNLQPSASNPKPQTLKSLYPSHFFCLVISKTFVNPSTTVSTFIVTNGIFS